MPEFAIFGGSANVPLTEGIAGALRTHPGDRELERFPDGEVHVQLLDTVRDRQVYLIQPTGPPVADHLLELLLLADASRRAGADSVIAVMPYFGYARQDRRVHGREAVGARVVADLLRAVGVQHIVGLDVHNEALEGFFGVPFEHLSAVDLLADAVRPQVGEDSVVVAPDLGAAKLAERYAMLLDLPVAIVHKSRASGDSVSVRAITGHVRGRTPVIVDDMISTAGTVVAATNAVIEAGCQPEITVLASHALLVGPAVERLQALPLRRMIVTDSLPQRERQELRMQVVSVAGLLADAISRLHTSRSLEGLLHGHRPARSALPG
jgi:ribose-phosphate pyrophosphokinase